MNGLRVYIASDISEKDVGGDVFYCRRENGPYYRWSYEAAMKEWRVKRVPSSESFTKVLCAASWKGVPAALRRRIVEHYQD